ncbi:MAG: hypothetical protein Ct9H90mP16_02080 [Candidatus Poseidoniales archaeon]|nr:MAG: hypothetical protein Ct9H90mP16_02080 [Candidatus Poseidoniales archaeon]
MEVIDRKENSVLNRVEISWQWRHVGAPTPTRNEIVAASSNSNLVQRKIVFWSNP